MAKALTPQQRKFKTAALTCHAELRRGELPKKGNFAACMRFEMGKGKRKPSKKGRGKR